MPIELEDVRKACKRLGNARSLGMDCLRPREWQVLPCEAAVRGLASMFRQEGSRVGAGNDGDCPSGTQTKGEWTGVSGLCVVMECLVWRDARASGSGLGCQTSKAPEHSGAKLIHKRGNLWGRRCPQRNRRTSSDTGD